MLWDYIFLVECSVGFWETRRKIPFDRKRFSPFSKSNSSTTICFEASAYIQL